MKKITIFILTIMMLLTSVSCTNQNEVVSSTEQEYNMQEKTHIIPIEQALKSLRNFMATTNVKTRSASSDIRIAKIMPVGLRKKPITRSEETEDEMDAEDLIYVADFEDMEGFAILAADDRVRDEVLAVAEEGTITEEAIEETVSDILGTNHYYEGYPDVDSCFFTVDEYPDEEFFNPNATSLYDEKADEAWVGNFSDDNNGEEDEDGNLIINDVEDDQPLDEIIPQKIILRYSLFHVIREITKDNSQNNTFRVTNSESEWENISGVTPLLDQFKSWRQESPFNDLCPKRRKYILFGHKKRTKAGCFPLAISKIMAYFETPTYFTYNGHTVNWYELKNNIRSTEGSKSAAHLLRGVGGSCKSKYFYSGTFTLPSDTYRFMKEVGLSDAGSHRYRFDLVKEMLNNGWPMIIYGIPGINITNSHAWNIDGYKIKKKTFTENKYINNELISTTIKTDTCNMVHCDLGWGGNYNGYYVSGIFNLNNNDNEYDGNHSGEKRKYNTYVKLLTYNRK